MHLSGNLRKMEVGIDSRDMSVPVKYALPLGSASLPLNELTGNNISIEWKKKINCIYCGRETRQSFAQGYCYPCFISLPQTDACILRPEKCQAHLGISRDMAWSERNCLQDHFVYLALSPGLKVGVTRKSQVPVRWIDQGASQAIKLALAPNRYIAGTIEVEMKKHLSDKTNWRDMLRGMVSTGIDLREEKERAASLLPADMKKYLSEDDEIFEFTYPVEEYPVKLAALKLEKNINIEGVLEGMKGQYLIFKGGNVLNIRKYGGYLVDFYY